MKRRHLVLAVLAIVLVLCASIGAASAYFTTYADAKGGYIIHVGHESEIHESVDGTVKSVQIQNIANSAEDVGKAPIFVRAKVYYGTDCTVEVSGSGWTQDGNVYYYEEPLYAGTENAAVQADDAKNNSMTTILTVDVKPASETVKEGDTIDVIITYDSVPAVFTASGAADRSASWANAAAIQPIN